MDERRLIERAKKNSEAMSTLLKEHYPFVYGYLLKMTCNEEIAKDITQDTMVKAIIYIDSFKFKSKFSTWLITIANNTYKNYLKKNKRHHLSLDDIYTDSFNLEDKVVNHQLYIKVLKSLQKLKEKQRMPFILKHYYGYSYEEIADMLSCPIGTVRSRIHNTIKKLQLELGGELDELQHS